MSERKSNVRARKTRQDINYFGCSDRMKGLHIIYGIELTKLFLILGLVQSEQNLRKKIEEMGSSAHVSEGAAVSNAQQAAETRVVQQDPSIEGKVCPTDQY